MGRFKFRWTSLNCDGRRGLALLGICSVMLLLAQFGHAAVMSLRYDRAAVAAGEWWRLFSAHFVHLGLAHTALNSAGLILLWVLFAREYPPWRWFCIVLAAIATIDAGLWIRDIEVEWYVGLSGVLHGVMAAGTLSKARSREAEGYLLAAFLIAKLAYEQSVGAMPLTAGVGPVIVNAHLYGAIGGIAGALLQVRRRPL